MRRLRTNSFLILVVALVGLLAVACDSGTQEPAAPTPSAPDSAAAKAVGDTAAAPTFPESRYPTDLPEGVRGVIPDSFPKGIPIYPGSAPAQGRGAEMDGVPMAAVQLLTMDPPEKVVEFYRKKMSADGWVIDESEKFRGKNAIAASNGECKASLLVAPTEDGGSDIFVITEC